MADAKKDIGVMQVLLERFNTQRLPRALDIKKKVDAGELLLSEDVAYLEHVLADAQQIQSLVDKHPEYRELVARATHLYNEITAKALENEKSKRS
jgi:hypothetical protein